MMRRMYYNQSMMIQMVAHVTTMVQDVVHISLKNQEEDINVPRSRRRIGVPNPGGGHTCVLNPGGGYLCELKPEG